MIALEVSSAAGKKSFGGVPGSIRNLVRELLALDPETVYALCYRFSRWRKGGLLRPDAPNVRIRLLQDPFNKLLIPRARLLHSMGIFMPTTPRIPKILTVHDLNAVRNVQWVSERWHERRSGRIEEALRRTDHVMTYSRFTADEICEHYGLPSERVHPVLLGVDTELFRPAPDDAVRKARSAHGDFVLAIGLVTPRKNFVKLAEAVSRLDGLRLVIVGKDSDGKQAFEDAIDALGMRERVTRLTGVPHEDLLALLGAARVVAVPSLYEGFGLTVLEAMACDAPVVCSTAASLPEAAGDAALMVDADDVEALAHALGRVAADPDLAGSLVQKGRLHVKKMTWAASARRLRDLYTDISGI